MGFTANLRLRLCEEDIYGDNSMEKSKMKITSGEGKGGGAVKTMFDVENFSS